MSYGINNQNLQLATALTGPVIVLSIIIIIYFSMYALLVSFFFFFFFISVLPFQIQLSKRERSDPIKWCSSATFLKQYHAKTWISIDVGRGLISAQLFHFITQWNRGNAVVLFLWRYMISLIIIITYI
jgi:hypothetical protein